MPMSAQASSAHNDYEGLKWTSLESPVDLDLASTSLREVHIPLPLPLPCMTLWPPYLMPSKFLTIQILPPPLNNFF